MMPTLDLFKIWIYSSYGESNKSYAAIRAILVALSFAEVRTFMLLSSLAMQPPVNAGFYM